MESGAIGEALAGQENLFRVTVKGGNHRSLEHEAKTYNRVRVVAGVGPSTIHV
jgi:hypothetical protein